MAVTENNININTW